MSILLFYIREFDHWLKPNDKIKKLYDSFFLYKEIWHACELESIKIYKFNNTNPVCHVLSHLHMYNYNIKVKPLFHAGHL